MGNKNKNHPEGKSSDKSPSEVVTPATTNEKMLQQCHKLYTDPENGLMRIGRQMECELVAPRKKINVLLIGNHSAGKSSFINWYVEEHVQKTGVAMETQGFTFITSGRKRESLTGNATLHLYPHFEPLRNIDGVVDYLSTEISTSKQKKFSLVTFIDTPGLVDGEMKYPYDVDAAILWLGDMADLIFVFFDPMGKALCKRTLNIVEKLSQKHSDRIKFYLSKADEAGNESDRQRVMMQIVQELCRRPCLNRTGFDMPTIYIPNPSGKPTRCVNQIEEVCLDVEKTINHTVQNTLNCLESDCDKITLLIDARLQKDRDDHSSNYRAFCRRIFFYLLGFLFPLLFLSCLFSKAVTRGYAAAVMGDDLAGALTIYADPLSKVCANIPLTFNWCIGLFLLSLLPILCTRFFSSSRVTLTKKQKKELLENREYVQKYVKGKKETLYKEYLKQSVGDHDLH